MSTPTVTAPTTDRSSPGAHADRPSIPGLGLAPLHPTAPHVVVFTRPGCNHCTFVLNRLAAVGVPRITGDLDLIVDEVVSAGIAEAPLVVLHNILDTDGSPLSAPVTTPVSVAFSGTGIDHLRTVKHHWSAVRAAVCDGHSGSENLSDPDIVELYGRPATATDYAGLCGSLPDAPTDVPPIPWQIN